MVKLRLATWQQAAAAGAGSSVRGTAGEHSAGSMIVVSDLRILHYFSTLMLQCTYIYVTKLDVSALRTKTYPPIELKLHKKSCC